MYYLLQKTESKNYYFIISNIEDRGDMYIARCSGIFNVGVSVTETSYPIRITKDDAAKYLKNDREFFDLLFKNGLK